MGTVGEIISWLIQYRSEAGGGMLPHVPDRSTLEVNYGHAAVIAAIGEQCDTAGVPRIIRASDRYLGSIIVDHVRHDL